MARRKRHHTRRHHTTHHRRRVSGVKDLDFTVIALLVGGAVVSRVISNKLSASTNATMVKFAPYVGVIGGIVIPMVSKSPMLKAISYGLIAGGATSALGPSGLKVISGIENTVAGMMGYPPNVIQPYRRVAGLNLPGGGYVTKANFSGSGKSQMNVIGGMNQDGSGGASCIG